MNPADVGSRLAAIVPGQEALTLRSRSTSAGVDTFTETVLPNCRRRPLSTDELIMVSASIGQQWFRFQVYNPPVVPKSGDFVRDGGNTEYVIRLMPDSRSVQGVYNLFCLRDV